MKIHRVVLYVIDFDGLGAAEVQQVIENTKYPNRCISPSVSEVQTRDIGQWSDEHPLNQMSTAKATRDALFAQPEDPKVQA